MTESVIKVSNVINVRTVKNCSTPHEPGPKCAITTRMLTTNGVSAVSDMLNSSVRTPCNRRSPPMSFSELLKCVGMCNTEAGFDGVEQF